jgi:hypothetical protein
MARPYVSLMRDTINIIRAQTPNRLIVIDANQRQPQILSQFGVPTHNLVLSSRGYAPWSVTHEGMMYQTQIPANFTNAQLTWPIRNYFNGFIYAPWHSNHIFGVENTRAVFNHPAGFAEGTVSMVIVNQFLPADHLALICDGVITARVTSYKSEDGMPWTVAFPENSVPAGTRRVEIIITEGDWVNVDSFNVSGVFIDCTNIDWGYHPSEMTVGVDAITNADTLRNLIFPSYPNPSWDNIPVMIGEMGCMAATPQQAAYRANLFRDYVDAFADKPWAFWEFKGGAMSLFRLNQNEIFTDHIDVHYTTCDGEEQMLTYYYDKLWYDAIKHRLNISE